MATKKHIITIAGRVGSGKSSTAKLVAERLGFRHFSSGDLFREIASRSQMDLLSANINAEKNPDIDHQVDSRLREIGETESNLVIDSRTAWHWIPESFKVYLTLDTHIAAERIIADRADKQAVVNENIPSDTTEYAEQLDDRYASENKRYMTLYGIDPSNEAVRLSKERVPYGRFTTEDEFEEIKQFDLVFCLGVAEHVEDLLYFLKGLKRKVKSGGVCYLEVPHNLLYSKGPETYRRLTTRSKQIEWHLPRKRWERIILASGFEIVKSYTGLNATWEYIWVLK